MRDSNIAGIIRRQARERADRTAYVTPTRTWTFAEVDAESSRVAQGLASLGVGPGDRVACLTKHMAECGVLLLAACKLGAVCMPVNWRLAAPEIEYIVDHGQAKFMMVDEAFAETVARAKLPGLLKTVATEVQAGVAPASGNESFAAWRARFDAVDPGHEAQPDDTTLQLYSSGTTGLPKGVEISNRGLLATLAMYEPMIGFDGERSVMLDVLPTFHIAGQCNLVMPMAAGARNVFFPEFDPAVAIAAIGEHRVTHSFLVPAMILFMLQSPAARTGDFSSLEVIAYGGSPSTDTVLSNALATFGCGLFQIYGMTELPMITNLLPADHDPGGARSHLLRSAGTPASGVELRIVDRHTLKDLPEGEVGEIWVRSLQNMKGYWRNPKATAATFPEGKQDGKGWMRTGDAGYLKDGYLFIHDRIKDMVISGGENIYPAEVENVLAKHPAVLECAIIGVPDEKWGESVKACVVLKPGAQASEQEIIAFMRENLAHYKCPKSVDFHEVLPRNPSGKLLKRVLREPFWQGRDRAVS
ncbi:MAG TPA: long-chain-fatty-acid--CoA ligase [Quisquiliibacterium sp.]|nr:long-chain-fatty-acid--CoA ligase [Quisquiliibacterium sp.]